MKAAAAVGCAWLAACAGTLPALKYQQTLNTELGRFEIHSNEADDADVGRVVEAVRNAVPQLKRWGEFHQVVHTYVLDNHQQLERAAGRKN